MDIKTLLEKAIKAEQVDMQALILFLVMEKQVLNMEDDSKELDLYFKTNNRNRMNKELRDYKRKLQMNYKPNVYKVITDSRTLYVYARDTFECNALAVTLSNEVISINVCVDDEVVKNGIFRTIKDMTKNKETPVLLGSNTSEKNYKGVI